MTMERIVRTPSPALPPAQARALEAFKMQRYRVSYPYHSSVKFLFTKSGAGPFVYTINAGTEIRAFAYAQRQPMLAGGFNAGDGNGTPADTNIIEPGQTISGESVLITGLAIQLLHGGVTADEATGTYPAGEVFSDARALAQIETNVSCRIEMNGGKVQHELGILSMLPGAGGLTGQGFDSLGTQPIDGGRPQFGFHANGWPVRSNHYRLPEGLVWFSKGLQDSNLNIVFRAERALLLHSGGTVDNAADDEAAAAGVRGYSYPANLLVMLKVILVGEIVGPRSRML